MKKQQSGFTLVEIAIVMVIIGLLLGGVLKGQEVITNAKIKNVNNDFSGVSAAVYSYQDRYSALPGDDLTADAHVGVAAANVGDGDGIIEGTLGFRSVTATDETRLAWEHLRRAGLISGDSASTLQPNNALGGITGIATGNGAGGDLNGFSGLLVGFTRVDADMAVILDAQNDDGVPDTGSIRTDVTIGAAGPPVVPGAYDLTAAAPYNLVFEM